MKLSRMYCVTFLSEKVDCKHALLELGKSILPPRLVRWAERYASICEMKESLVEILAVRCFAQRIADANLDDITHRAVARRNSHNLLDPLIINPVHNAPPGHKAVPLARIISNSGCYDVFHDG